MTTAMDHAMRVLLVTEDPFFIEEARAVFERAGAKVISCLGPAHSDCHLYMRGSCPLANRSAIKRCSSLPDCFAQAPKEEVMKISELKPRMPVTVEENESLVAAAKLLADEDIGALIVFEPRGLAGVLSERDIVRAVADGFDLEETEVCEYMTPAAVVAEGAAVIGDAIAKMNDSGIRHIVVTSNGDVSGMISMRDVVGLLGTHWPEM